MDSKAIREKLNAFYQSDAAKLTVKELLTGTSGVALATISS